MLGSQPLYKLVLLSLLRRTFFSYLSIHTIEAFNIRHPSPNFYKIL